MSNATIIPGIYLTRNLEFAVVERIAGEQAPGHERWYPVKGTIRGDQYSWTLTGRQWSAESSPEDIDTATGPLKLSGTIKALVLSGRPSTEIFIQALTTAS
jgi:hypothetical protein